MEYRKLGNSELNVSVVSFGCWQMGGGWGEVEERDFQQAVDAAIESGINLFDTAEGYGSGASEEILGRCLKAKRDKVLVATKIFTGKYKLEDVEPHLDRSLARLQMEYVDLYQYHWPRQAFDQAAADDAMNTMLRLKEKGKIRAFGVSNFFADQMEMCLKVTPQLASDQPPYSILWREIEESVLPFCRKNNVAVLAYSPLAQGILTGKYNLENRPTGKTRLSNIFFKDENYERALEVVDVMRPIAEKHGKTMAQVAVNWLLAQPGMTSAICGAKSAKQAIDNAGAAGWQLAPDEIDAIGKAGMEFYEGLSGAASMWNFRPDPKG